MISTFQTGVLSTKAIDKSELAPCSNEQADTRIMLHLADAAKQGISSAVIRTVDTGVVVLAIQSASRLNLHALWILLEQKNTFVTLQHMTSLWR